MPKWSTVAATSILRDLIIPAGGMYGILFDRPLDPWVGGAYLVMMGLPIGGLVDRIRTKSSSSEITPSEKP